MKNRSIPASISFLFFLTLSCSSQNDIIEPINENILDQNEKTYNIVDTKVSTYYSNDSKISTSYAQTNFPGQDAQFQINSPSYTDNNDGTISDNVTGLMWQSEMEKKITYDEAFQKASDLSLGSHTDWRVPTIKELYSLIIFTGQVHGGSAVEYFIDTDYFDQPLGDTSIGEREIDAQTWSSTQYAGTTMHGDATVFGVNFIDGRIKGYPKYSPSTGDSNKMYFRMVRGNIEYGKNNFVDNGDGTISDLASGLMWQKEGSSEGMDWENALQYSNNLNVAGYTDWRLPNAKELQSIVHYERSLQTTNSPAIAAIFSVSTIIDPNGNTNYPYYWSSTTHLDGQSPESHAVYIAFGEAQGYMHGSLLDVHGAGAQRSDPKSGSKDEYPQFFGPQGDIRYVYNYVRSVRSIN